ncbi:MAG: hypothetical protein WA174_14085 [Rhodoferax sp.]
MSYSLSNVVVMVALALGCSACDKFKPALPEVAKPPAPATQVNPADSERAAFTQEAQKDLDELRAMISGLKAQAAQAGRETNARLQADIEKLELELRDTQQRLTALKAATEDTRQQLKAAFATALDQLKYAIEKVRKSAE